MSHVYFIQYTNPACYPPLEHASQILADAGMNVVFLGVHVAGVESLAFPPHPRIVVENMAQARPGWRQRLRYLRYLGGTLWRLLRARPAWVYASDGWSYPIGLAASWIPGVRVVLHEHDAPATSGSALARLIGWARRWLARRASACVIPQTARARQFGEQYRPLPLHVVWNCPRRDEIGVIRTSPPSRPLCLVYQGSITSDRPPAALVEALGTPPLSRMVSLAIIGYETASCVGRTKLLLNRAAELGIGDFVTALGPLSRHEMLTRSRDYHVGIALLPGEMDSFDMRNMVGASNKPFDYLSQGLALLTNDSPEWREFFGPYGRGCEPDDPASIASALRWFLDHPAETQAMGEAGRQRALEDWNYEKQFEPVRRLIMGWNK